MALKRALLASYAGQVYVALIGIAMMPVYLRYLGAEAYGLIGFFAMLQVWLQLLDLGLTPTLSRELSRFHAGVLDGSAAAILVRSLEWLFGLLALICIGIAALASEWVAMHWLNPEGLAADEVATSVAIMGMIGGVRWLTGLYRSGLIGLEKQVWVNGASAVTATLKSVGVTLVLVYISAAPVSFFIYQGGVAILELLLFRRMLYRYLSADGIGFLPQWSALRRVGRFASSMAFMAGIWVTITQIDKLILSHFLTLKDYGYFTLATVAASGITLLSVPLGQALQPRFTVLAAQHRETELIELYRTTSQFATALMASLAGIMALFAEPLIMAWTGNVEAAHQAAPILFWYALGNGIVGLLAMPFLLQYARGSLRLHVFGNLIFAVTWLPAMTYAATRAGAIGAGMVWMIGNLIFLLVWTPLVHSRMAPGLKWSWLIWDVGAIVAPIAVLLVLLSQMDITGMGRFGTVAFLALSMVVLTGLGGGAGSRGRSTLRMLYGKNQ